LPALLPLLLLRLVCNKLLEENPFVMLCWQWLTSGFVCAAAAAAAAMFNATPAGGEPVHDADL
jgi:hypothetical protein